MQNIENMLLQNHGAKVKFHLNTTSHKNLLKQTPAPKWDTDTQTRVGHVHVTP